MHLFEKKPPFAPARLAARLVICALLPVLTQEATAHASPRAPSRPGPERALPASRPAPREHSTPYLLACLPPPLRFAERVEIADPASHEAGVLGPPRPSGLTEEIAAANQGAALPPDPVASHQPAPQVPGPDTPVRPPAVPEPAPPSEAGVSIIPDDTRRDMGSADVLPYFQFPTGTPSGGQPPRSSATYQQQ